MKKLIVAFTVLCSLMIISCSKPESEKNGSNTGTELKFLSLTPQDTVLSVNGITSITANATGSGLTYKWTASYGSFIGSGSTVKWTVCHSDKFTVSCEVKDDQGHSDSKTVSINVH